MARKPKAVHPFDAVAARARNGDESVLPAVRAEVAREPRYIAQGDMGYQSELAWLNLIAPKDLLAREIVRQRAAQLREELESEACSPLERLLIQRIALCWLQVHQVEMTYAQLGISGMSMEQAESLQRRIDKAHKRYLGAIRTLAQVRRLQLPPVQVNIADQQVNVAQVNGMAANRSVEPPG